MDLKLAQTKASEEDLSLERVDSTEILSALIETEIAFYRAHPAVSREQSLVKPPASLKQIPAQRVTAQVAPFRYELDVNGVLDACLLYLWEIRDAAGVLLGKYLGKATRHYRPLTRYGKRVLTVMAGTDGRLIHHSLANAAIAGHHVKLTLLCNTPDGEALRVWENHAIAALDCFGNRPEQLNATRGRLLPSDQVPEELADVVRAAQARLR